ncbi:MAG: hypothetical protein ACRD0K_06980 [Egibacteraceae bacterium]
MGQDERNPHTPTEHEPTPRLSPFQEEEPREPLRLPSPPPPAAVLPGSARRSQRHEHSRQRRPATAVAGLIGLALGVAATLFVTGTAAQREVTDRDARITQLTSQFDQSQAERQAASARLDGREAALDQRSAELHSREAALAGRETILVGRERELGERERLLVGREAAPDQRGRELARRGAAPRRRVAAPGIDLPDGALGRLGQGLQGLIDRAVPGR